MVRAIELYTDYVNAKNQVGGGEDPEILKRSLIELLNNDLGGENYRFNFDGVNEGTPDKTLEQYSGLWDYATDNGTGDLVDKVDNLYKSIYNSVDVSVTNFSSTVLKTEDKNGNRISIPFQPENTEANISEIPNVEGHDGDRAGLMIMLVGQRILTNDRFSTLYDGIVFFDKSESNIQLAAKLYVFKNVIESFKMDIREAIPGLVLPKKDSHKELIKNTIEQITTELPTSVEGTGAAHSVISEMLYLSEHILSAHSDYEETLTKLIKRNEEFDHKDRENTIVINNLISNLDTTSNDLQEAQNERAGLVASLRESTAAFASSAVQLEEQTAQLDAVTVERDRLDASLGEARRQLEAVTGERDRLDASLGEATRQLEAVTGERDQLQEQLSRIQAVITPQS